MFTESVINAIKKSIRYVTDESDIEFGRGDLTWNKATATFTIKIVGRVHGSTNFFSGDNLKQELISVVRRIKVELNDVVNPHESNDKIKLVKYRGSLKKLSLTFESLVNGKTLEELNIGRYAESYDITKYVGKQLRLRQTNKKLKIIGIKPTNTKYPIIIEMVKEMMEKNEMIRYKVSPSYIKSCEIIS